MWFRQYVMWLLLGIAPTIDASSFTEFQKLEGSGKLEQALQVLRSEFASPSFVHGSDLQKVMLRHHFLIAFGKYANLTGVTPEKDAEANKLYEEGLDKFAGNDPERQAFMLNGIAMYYSYSHRNGQALPFLRRELQVWESKKNPFRLMLTNKAVAGAYWDMGEQQLARHFVARSIEEANKHFVVGERPKDINEWLVFDTALGEEMDWCAQLGDVEALERLWKLKDPIGRTYWKVDSLTKMMASQYFAAAGQPDRARGLLNEAKEVWPKERLSIDNDRFRKSGDAALACAAATVDFFAGEYRSSATGYGQCMQLTALIDGIRDSDLNTYQKLGYALERVGELDRAAIAYRESITAAEKTRGSFSVAERGKFFRTIARVPYWGLVRIAAGRAVAGDRAAFFEALHASEMVRGRQLGELIDQDMAKRISPASLQALQQRIPSGTAILAYTATEHNLVLLGLTRDRFLAASTPYDGKAFAKELKGVAEKLADPGSNVKLLEQRLLRLSKQILGPARTLLAGKKRIIALPDGAMNIVPFDILSASDEHYRPLVNDYVVSASPSLVFIEHIERQQTGAATSLFALADPQYVPPLSIAGAASDEVRQATRGSRYLSYFQSLPETRSEVKTIARMFPGQTVNLLLGEQALESKVKAVNFQPFDYLHFATHGILGGEVPGLGEPALVLGSEPGEDGFLTSSEVGKLALNAQLTVLSACNTGSGEFVTGEGVMGMSRAFLAAGSRSVVVSLWPVASEQTERLMVEFYRLLRTGKAAAEALRETKLKFIENARKKRSGEDHPFYWAPFIILG